MIKRKIVERVLLVGIACLINKINSDKKILKICEKKDCLIFKQEKVLSVYEKWINLDRKQIPKLLIKNNYCKVAIYGLGRLGKQLYRELIFSEVNIVYIIDRQYGLENEFYNSTVCFNCNDDLPNVDLIIVTIPGEAKEIAALLRKKVNCPIKSIDEIFFVI